MKHATFLLPLLIISSTISWVFVARGMSTLDELLQHQLNGMERGASLNDFKDIISFIELKANINTQSKSGNTILTTALSYNNEKLIHSALEAKADIEKQNEYGDTALIIAAQKGHLNIVNSLLAAKAVVNKKDKWKHTSLQIAAHCNNKPVIKALLEAKANISHITQEGKTVYAQYPIVKEVLDVAIIETLDIAYRLQITGNMLSRLPRDLLYLEIIPWVQAPGLSNVEHRKNSTIVSKKVKV